jgi:hypothetical protein
MNAPMLDPSIIALNKIPPAASAMPMPVAAFIVLCIDRLDRIFNRFRQRWTGAGSSPG